MESLVDEPNSVWGVCQSGGMSEVTRSNGEVLLFEELISHYLLNVHTLVGTSVELAPVVEEIEQLAALGLCPLREPQALLNHQVSELGP